MGVSAGGCHAPRVLLRPVVGGRLRGALPVWGLQRHHRDPAAPSPGHGLAFVVFDADKQCYYDHDSNAFFLDERLSMSTAARAQAAAENAARAQTDKIRAMAEAEAAEAARVANLQRDRDAQLANAAANAAAQAREHAAAPATGGSAFERMMADEHNVFAGMSAYERYTNDPGNPFEISPRRSRSWRRRRPRVARAAEAEAKEGSRRRRSSRPTVAPVEPPHGHIKSNGHAAPPRWVRGPPRTPRRRTALRTSSNPSLSRCTTSRR